MAEDQATCFDRMEKNTPRAIGEAYENKRRHFPNNEYAGNINQR